MSSSTGSSTKGVFIRLKMTVNTVILEKWLQFKTTIFLSNTYSMQFIPLIVKLNFQTLLQSSVSHDPSEISLIWLFAAQET